MAGRCEGIDRAESDRMEPTGSAERAQIVLSYGMATRQAGRHNKIIYLHLTYNKNCSHTFYSWVTRIFLLYSKDIIVGKGL